MQFGTTFTFLEYFGLASLDDLPSIDEHNDESMAAEGIGLRSIRPADDTPGQ